MSLYDEEDEDHRSKVCAICDDGLDPTDVFWRGDHGPLCYFCYEDAIDATN